MNLKQINRIKVVLVEQNRTSKWLSEQLNVSSTTVSNWCRNSNQPDLQTLLRIATLLDVELGELLTDKRGAKYDK